MSKIRPHPQISEFFKNLRGGLISGFEKCLKNRFLTLGIENYDQDGHFLSKKNVFLDFFVKKSVWDPCFRGGLILDIEVPIFSMMSWEVMKTCFKVN